MMGSGKEPVFTRQQNNLIQFDFIQHHVIPSKYLVIYSKQPDIEVFTISRHIIWTPMRRKNGNNVTYVCICNVCMQFQSIFILKLVHGNRVIEYHIYHQKTVETQSTRQVHTIGS